MQGHRLIGLGSKRTLAEFVTSGWKVRICLTARDRTRYCVLADIKDFTIP